MKDKKEETPLAHLYGELSRRIFLTADSMCSVKYFLWVFPDRMEKEEVYQGTPLVPDTLSPRVRLLLEFPERVNHGDVIYRGGKKEGWGVPGRKEP